MRISDWSSDVCSSDLRIEEAAQHGVAERTGSAGDEQSFVVEHRLSSVRPARRGNYSQLGQVTLSTRYTKTIRCHLYARDTAAHSRRRLASIASSSAKAFDRCARSEEHTSELQSLLRTTSAVICWKKNKHNTI